MILRSLAVCAAIVVSTNAIAQSRRPVPYWVSQSASQAMMRHGPGLNFPAMWKYVRPELPLRVIQVRQEWRKVEDPNGVQGWVRANLLSEQRTAIVVGGAATMHAAPHASSRVAWRVEPGVVGKIAHCSAGWCEFDVRGRVGHIEISHLWGVAPDEVVK